MRRTIALMLSALSPVLFTMPALALDRLPVHGGEGMVVQVADLDRPVQSSAHQGHRADAYWHWRYRAAYTRWMHNEYVRAGYPVRHRQFRTYPRYYGCCHRSRH